MCLTHSASIAVVIVPFNFAFFWIIMKKEMIAESKIYQHLFGGFISYEL